jgi:adenosylmethionine-8-amino-7-oxononanoate aminotransferase
VYPIWHPYTSAADDPPLCVKKARGSQIELSDGKKLIDAIGSWWTSVFGHSFPPLVRELQKQAEELDHALFGSVTHEPAQKVSNQLCGILGPGKVIFSDNGSTAIEIGMKLACHLAKLRKESKRTFFASFEGGYHGDTIGVMSLQGNSLFTAPYSTLLRKGVKIPFVETWDEDETVEKREKQALIRIESILKKSGQNIIAFVFEPLLQGSSGMRICRPQFLKKVTELMTEHGILLIADEVLTGLGRTGDIFACNKANVKWDILALSKGLTGGMLPLAITFLEKEIFDEFFQHDVTLFHGHTFTANPIACSVAAKTLELLIDYPSYFQEFEKRYQPFLQEAKKMLVRVRTLGCMWAGELPFPLTYGSKRSLALRKLFLEQGILARPLGSVLYFLPAYTISDEELANCFYATFSIIEKIKD